MNKFYLLPLLVALSTTAFAQEKFEQGKPANDAYRYLDNYDALKDYIDYSKYPNFKLGAGTTVDDYLNNQTYRKMINSNFTETVAGNAMKMASCVDGNGNMNFGKVRNYVNTATVAGINVYGHTLAWHSQQAKGWLLKLLADKPDPDAGEVFAQVAGKDFRTSQNVGWKANESDNGYEISFDATNGLKVNAKVSWPWQVQFVAWDNIVLDKSKTYKMIMTVKGSKSGKLDGRLGDWDGGTSVSFNFTTEWQDVEISVKPTMENSFLLLHVPNYVGVVYIKSIRFEGDRPARMISQTRQEMHDTLVYAMDKWIKGLMEACAGKVKAWDLVNEAISGGGNDGSGNYTLQHSGKYIAGSNPDATWDVGGDAFYWQDYMGDLEYVRQACRLARKYGPDDVVLFINDYNLESDWDNNKKVKSLIAWIKKWEADGVTRIDGIGTQMHISYYENSTTQANKKSAITNMFRLMANTGKYVRVSELDMGYVDINGNNVPTGNMTEAQHKNMANFYEWIIKEYFRLVPASQQWGICQWCTQDSKGGWRANTPVGIWDGNGYRKHVYAGFVRGLGGVSSDINDIKQDASLDLSDGVYNLVGMRIQAESFDELPSGIYIINGRKVVK